MLQYIKMYKMWKGIKQNMNEDKNWYCSKKFFDSVLALVGKCLSSFFEVNVPQEKLEKISDNFLAISCAIKEVLPDVILIVKEVKSKKAVEITEEDLWGNQHTTM